MTRRRTSNRPTPRRAASAPEPDGRTPLRRSFESDDLLFFGQFLLDRCGTLAAVEALTDDPLPPERFDDDAVPAQDRAIVGTVLDLIEPVCERHLDGEYATVLKRLVAIAAAHPQRPLRTRTSPDRLAAAMVWIALVGNADRRVGTSRGAGSIWWWFEVTSCTKLARTVATTLGFRPEPRFDGPVGWDQDLGVYFRSSALLQSRCRRLLISQRESVNARVVEEEERRRLARPAVRSGTQVRMRMVESDFALAMRTSVDGGRQMVVLGLGGTSEDPDHLFALSIPEARRLAGAMRCALDAVAVPTQAATTDGPP